MSQDIIEQLRGRHECGMNAHGYDLKLHYEAADTIESLRARVAELEAEVLEQCRLNGMGSEREYALQGKVAAKDQRIAELEAECEFQRVGHNSAQDKLLEQGKELAAQALTIKTMRTALMRIKIWHGEFPETGRFWDEPNNTKPMSYSACFGSNGERDYMREIASEAIALPDNSTEILQEWFDKQLGDPVAFIRHSDEEDRMDGRDYEGVSLTNFIDPEGFPVYRKPEIK